MALSKAGGSLVLNDGRQPTVEEFSSRGRKVLYGLGNRSTHHRNLLIPDRSAILVAALLPCTASANALAANRVKPMQEAGTPLAFAGPSVTPKQYEIDQAGIK